MGLPVNFKNTLKSIFTYYTHTIYIMATEIVTTTQINSADALGQSQYPREPLRLAGALETYESFDVTPVIGREFKDVNLKDWLQAPNSDELIRDLAITSKTCFITLL